MFQADRAIDHAFVRMEHAGRRARPAAKAVVNVLTNLEEPATAANSLLQRKPRRALGAVARFLVNSTIGLAGLFDVAERMGLHGRREDFGRTLAMYGVRAGPYVYLPLLGPTTARDLAGGMVDGFLSPMRLLHLNPLESQANRVVRQGIRASQLAADGPGRDVGARRQAADDYETIRARYLRRRIEGLGDPDDRHPARPRPTQVATVARPLP